MKVLKQQDGVAHIGLLLLALIVLAAIGFAGWRVKQTNKAANESETSSSTSSSTTAPSKAGTYESKELGLQFSYPSSWGEAQLSVGPEQQYSSSNYQQVTFSKQDLVDINFVLGPYSSPLDGCGLDPVKMVQHNLGSERAKTVGWNTKGVEYFFTGQGVEGEEVMTYSFEPSNTPGYTVLSKKGDVLVYQTPKAEFVYKAQTAEENGCFAISKSEADQANAYSKYVHFALNYSNKSVKGVNAQYDGRSAIEQSTITQVEALLASMKNL